MNDQTNKNIPYFSIAESICKQARIPLPIRKIEGGSRPLFEVGDRSVLKIFSPEDGHFCKTEALFLEQLFGKLPVATPCLQLKGSHQGHPWLLMDRMEGISLDKVWKTLSYEDHREIMFQLGETVHALHALDPTPFLPVEDWDSFIERQRANLANYHRNSGLDERWISDICEWVDKSFDDFFRNSVRVPLHTELMPEHLFVRKDNKHWKLCGMIDFEPSMAGIPHYDFCAVGLFFSCGNPNLLRTFLTAYGFMDQDLDEKLQGQLMTLLLLHRYSNLPWFMALQPETCVMQNCAELAQFWFSNNCIIL